VLHLDQELVRLLGEIREFGRINDSKITSHPEQMLNITPDTGLFLSIIIQATRAARVLEIGTSNGYSTLWIADALRSIHGKVTTVEVSQKKASMAKNNFERSRLSDYIDAHLADVRVFLGHQADESFDLIFLDAERPQYTSYWDDIDRVLNTGGLLIVDNALSPKPEELIDFLRVINDSTRYLSQTLQIGKGQMIALKQRKKE
jgi:predicted O-methyltransferase YrrM